MFEFDFLWAFAFLPAPLLVWWLLPPYRDQQESIRVPFFEQLSAAIGREPARGGVILRRNLLQKLLAPLVWVLAVTALARPQFIEPPIEKIESARDLMLAVDLSGSMDTQDMFDVDGNRVHGDVVLGRDLRGLFRRHLAAGVVAIGQQDEHTIFRFARLEDFDREADGVAEHRLGTGHAWLRLIE